MNTKTKNANQIILLNGKSVKNIENYKIQDTDTIYAVNRKSVIEEEFLKPQGRNVDVWIISNYDFPKMYDEICEFLARDEDNRLITYYETLLDNRFLLEAKPLPNPQKIIVVDQLFNQISEVFSSEGFNSLAVLLSILGINKQIHIALFGCDGLESEDEKNIYFNQAAIPKDRTNAIYEEMIIFDKYFSSFAKKFGLNIDYIQNINLDSCYKSFKKYREFQSTLKSKEKFILTAPNYTNADLIKLAVESRNLEINCYLKQKTKNNFFRKLRKLL